MRRHIGIEQVASAFFCANGLILFLKTRKDCLEGVPDAPVDIVVCVCTLVVPFIMRLDCETNDRPWPINFHWILSCIMLIPAATLAVIKLCIAPQLVQPDEGVALLLHALHALAEFLACGCVWRFVYRLPPRLISCALFRKKQAQAEATGMQSPSVLSGVNPFA
jgi:hypothetical protein